MMTRILQSHDGPTSRRPEPATWTAMLGGALAAAGLPPQTGFGWLVPAGLAILFTGVVASRRPARTAWLAALVQQTILLHWLFLLVPAKSIPTRALVPAQAVATILYVSVFYLLWGWVVGRVRRRGGRARALVLAPALWAGAEALRGMGEMGFPWCLTGSAALGLPVQSWLRTGGEVGFGVGVVLLAAALASAGLPRPVRRGAASTLAVACALWLAWLAAGSGVGDATTDAPAVEVAAVQADVHLADKWASGKLDSTKIPYENLTRLAAGRGAEFVVWAETAVPAHLRYDVPLLNWVRRLVRGTGIHLFTGFPDADRLPDGGFRETNSAGLMGPDGLISDRYAKHHLLPIGETIPFQKYIPALGGIQLGQAEWSPGDRPTAMTVDRGDGRTLPFAALVCFESVFSPLARDAVRTGAHCLVVITNDGWFGKSAGPRQHADLARIRAVELGVPVVRCANNGISFLCDDRGAMLDRLGLGRRGVVQAAVRPGPADTLYVRVGAWPAAAFLGLLALLGLVAPWLRVDGDD